MKRERFARFIDFRLGLIDFREVTLFTCFKKKHLTRLGNVLPRELSLTQSIHLGTVFLLFLLDFSFLSFNSASLGLAKNFLYIIRLKQTQNTFVLIVSILGRNGLLDFYMLVLGARVGQEYPLGGCLVNLTMIVPDTFSPDGYYIF